jgi:outer membrane murein-binding lipoprotein Lpp
MSWLKKHAASARVVGVIILGGLGLSACATREYVDQQIASVNTRIDQVGSQAQAAQSRADSAAQAAAAAQSRADAANQAAQAAATDARSANQRLDQLTGRVDTLEKPAARTGRTPRG